MFRLEYISVKKAVGANKEQIQVFADEEQEMRMGCVEKGEVVERRGVRMKRWDVLWRAVVAIGIVSLTGCAELAVPPGGDLGRVREPVEHRATGLKSFEGMEDPTMKYVVAKDACVPDDFVNITDEGDGTVKMLLRYHGDEEGGWWDGDQGTNRKDRQRAEIKGLGPHQRNGETFEYAMTWRTDAEFSDPAGYTTTQYDDETQKRRRHFCHVFQLKATDGDDGAPMITMSVEEGNSTASVDYWVGNAANPTVVRTFAWHPGEWHRVAIRVKTSLYKDGFVLVSVDGDAYSGVKGVDVYRPLSTNYRPKWGLYRATGVGAKMHDDWVEEKDVVVKREG